MAKFVTKTVAVYQNLVLGRSNPADCSELRCNEILQIIVSGPPTAVLRSRVDLRSKLFAEDLTSITFNGEWKIIAKVWGLELIAWKLFGNIPTAVVKQTLI